MSAANLAARDAGEALRGLRILEIGDGVALRYFGRLFAATGADVVRTRSAQADLQLGYGRSAGAAYGAWLDAGKRRDPAASGAFDVIICGQTPQALAQGEDAWKGAGGLLVALAWFDPAGPYGEWRATDETILALNGCAFGLGRPDGPPMLAQGHGPQVTAGVVAFNAALAALLAPAAVRPRRVDVNVLEASLCYAETAAVTAERTGAVSQRLGFNRFTPTYPVSAYRAADGWVGVTCLTPAQWRAFCALLDREDLAADPRFATADARLAIADEVDAVLAPEIARRTQADWVALGVAHRIPITAMPRHAEAPRAVHWRPRAAVCAVVRAAGDEAWLAVAAPDRTSQKARSGSRAPRSAGRWSRRWPASRAARSASSPTTTTRLRAEPWTPRPRTRRRGSCSSATPSTSL